MTYPNTITKDRITETYSVRKCQAILDIDSAGREKLSLKRFGKTCASYVWNQKTQAFERE